MATNTPRLNLRKPGASDNIDYAADLDANYDILDQAVLLGQVIPAHSVSVSISDHTVTLATGVQSVPAFDIEAIDTDAYHSVVVNATRLTVPGSLAGKYRVWGISEFGASAVGHRSFGVRVNGGAFYGISSAAPGISSDSVPTLSGSITLPLAVGDYVEMLLFQDSGGNLTFNANGTTRFGMDFLGS